MVSESIFLLDEIAREEYMNRNIHLNRSKPISSSTALSIISPLPTSSTSTPINPWNKMRKVKSESDFFAERLKASDICDRLNALTTASMRPRNKSFDNSEYPLRCLNSNISKLAQLLSFLHRLKERSGKGCEALSKLTARSMMLAGSYLLEMGRLSIVGFHIVLLLLMLLFSSAMVNGCSAVDSRLLRSYLSIIL
jgi:hypothetical protein